MTPEKARRMRDLSDELLTLSRVLELHAAGKVDFEISAYINCDFIWNKAFRDGPDGPIVDAILAELERRRREIDAELEAL